MQLGQLPGGCIEELTEELQPVLGAGLDSAQTKMFKAAQKQRCEEGNSREELQKPCSFVKYAIIEKKSLPGSLHIRIPALSLSAV